jgi:bifunctional non-homologous end joining protein LigD
MALDFDRESGLSFARRAQPVFYAFDLVWLNGKDLRELPLLERKEHLQELITKGNGPDIITAQFVEGSGTALFNEICRRNLEGIVCKRKSSVYSKNRRAWPKVKNRNYTQAKDRQDSTQVGNARSPDGGKHDDYPQKLH